MGGRPQQVGPMPRSPQRAAGLPLINTDTHVPNMTGPIGGRGVGGTGGGPLGGGATCACGAPIAMDISVAAGKEGRAWAIALVAVAKPSLSRLTARPGRPTTELTAPAARCSAFVGRPGAWAGGAGGKFTRGLLMTPLPSAGLATQPR